jgi:hypothetical protein
MEIFIAFRNELQSINYYIYFQLSEMTGTIKRGFELTEDEWQIVLDSLSNTVFNEEVSEEARKNAKDLFVKLQKELPPK